MEQVQDVPQLSDHTISRRGFLVRSAWLAAALGAGALACGREGSGSDYAALVPDGERPRVLPLREYAVLRAVTARMIPAEVAPPGALALGVAGRIDRELAFHGPKLRADVTDALRLVEWWPLATRGSRFTRLPARDQDDALAGMVASCFAARRSAFQGLKLLCVFFYYTQDATWPALGYDGPWVPRVAPAALA